MYKTATVLVTSPFVRAQAINVLDKLYELLGTDIEQKTGYQELAKVIGTTGTTMRELSSDFETAGVLRRRYSTTPKPNTGGRARIGGKISHWRLPLEQTYAQSQLAEFYRTHPATSWRETRDSQRARAAAKRGSIAAKAVIEDTPTEAEPKRGWNSKKARAASFRESASRAEYKAAIRSSHGEAVEAITGPERPSPFEVLRDERKDESAALVEAARQYGNRLALVKSKFAELEKLGISVDWTHVNDVVHFEKDERLEVISLVLPYIDQLERMLSRQSDVLTGLRERAKGSNDLVKENEKLREQNRRLIAEKVRAPVEAYR